MKRKSITYKTNIKIRVLPIIIYIRKIYRRIKYEEN